MNTDVRLDELLSGCSSVAISGHVRPDGDCVGSCLGLWLYLREYYPQIDAHVYLGPFSETFLFLDGADRIEHSAEQAVPVDLMFALDCGDAGRLDCFRHLLDTAGRSVNIDHHVTNTYFADFNHVDPHASSTSELVCDLIGTDKISRSAAEALYMGIVHDTGVFQYTCTSRHTMELAGALMEKGIAYSDIVENTFFTKTYRQKQILGRALLESNCLMNGKVIYTAITQKIMKFYGVDPVDLDGIVQQLRSTRGIEAAVFLYEKGPQEWKVSMRSAGKVDVSSIAVYFGGGGHKMAAGADMQGSMHDVLNNLTALIEQQLEGVCTC